MLVNMMNWEKLKLVFIPLIFGAIAFPLNVWATNQFEGFAHAGWIFALEAGLYFGVGGYFIVSYLMKKRAVEAAYVSMGLVLGCIAFFAATWAMFSLACGTGGGCV